MAAPGPSWRTSFVDAAWPVEALAVAPGAFCRGLAGPPLPVLGISVCGLTPEGLEAELDELERQQTAARNFLPLLITDQPQHLAAIRRRGWTAELLPSVEALAACPGQFGWRELLAHRLRLIAAQWRVAAFVDHGRRQLPLPGPVRAATPTLRLLYDRDYGRYNAYQKLLYSAMPGIAAEPGDVSAALALRRSVPAEVPVVFHLHLEDAVYAAETSTVEAAAAVEAFLQRLDEFLASGGWSGRCTSCDPTRIAVRASIAPCATSS